MTTKVVRLLRILVVSGITVDLGSYPHRSSTGERLRKYERGYRFSTLGFQVCMN